MIAVSVSSKRRLLTVSAWLLLVTLFLIRAQAVSAKPLALAIQNASENAGSENSSEDETTQFKHSASVRLLSKMTGLSPDGAYWLAVVLNFAIVAAAIAWISKQTLPQAFQNRTAAIQKSLEEARRASEDANRRLREVESRLAQLDQEIAQMRKLSEKEAVNEEQRARTAAGEEAERILLSAEQEIRAAIKAGKRELTAYAANLAVSLASKQIRVDTPTDEVLVRRFSRQLSSDGSQGNKA